ncbi:integrase [Streptomyces luteogriseus]|uniref:Integrase n=1 Tax=Streptomyces luteogriseus TaxID=68233 RepID=A0A7W7GKP2_9ACTN|nr:integrase [Streptomyces luteogriseus]
MNTELVAARWNRGRRRSSVAPGWPRSSSCTVAAPQARKEAVACRDYVMAKIACLSGVRAAELCAVCMRDVHWESGLWGRFLVHGKGARGSGPRQREAFLFEQGRELLWWYVEELRGLFRDDPEHPSAPLFPSERLPVAVAALNMPVAPKMVPSTFRRALRAASVAYLLTPDLPPSDRRALLVRGVALTT